MEQTSISSDLIRGHIDTIILHALTSGDKFAQQISDSVEEKSNSQYKINQATLYSSLKRLESLKYVTSYMNDIQGGRRKFFKITEEGKIFVDKNLSSWTFSRAIIDKLMDTKPEIQTIVYTQSPAVASEIKQEKSDEISNNSNENVAFSLVNSVENTQSEEIQEKIDKKPTIEVESQNSTSNFRSILGDLISSTKKTVITENSVEKTEIEAKNCDKTDEKVCFNEVIDDANYNLSKSNNNGKIDFGDLILNATEEGYKIRVSAKDSALSRGNVLINKVKFLSIFLVYLLSVIQIFTLDLLVDGVFSVHAKYIIISLLALIPAFYLVQLLKSPSFKTDKKLSGDKILTSLIVVFNLILITLAINFILDVNFNDIKSIVYYTVIPILIFINSTIYFVFEYLFAKNQKFNTKK